MYIYIYFSACVINNVAADNKGNSYNNNSNDNDNNNDNINNNNDSNEDDERNEKCFYFSSFMLLLVKRFCASQFINTYIIRYANVDLWFSWSLPLD